MVSNINIDQLARQYFEGIISIDDERRLLNAIDHDENMMRRFRAVGKEWAETYEADSTTNNQWQKLSSQLRITNIPKLHAVGFANSMRRVYISVAVLALILLMSVVVAKMNNQSVQETFYTCVAPYGSKTIMELPDGSKVWLNSGSSLKYSSHYSDDNRRVELQGEGFFEVAKRNGAEFVVATNGYDVVVKGTKFNVTAYKDDPFVTTSLFEGKVNVECCGETVKLQPGEALTYCKSTGSMSKTKFTPNSRVWVDGKFVSDAISLGEFAKIISRKYDINVEIATPELKAHKFSISLQNGESIDDVLNALDRIISIKVEKRGKKIIIK